MTTLYTHAVVGLGLGRLLSGRRWRWPFWVLVTLLPVVPDFDAFSPAGYGNIWGHRGFTHSLTFAFVIALAAAGLTYRPLAVRFWPLAGIYFVATASHGVLDACTRGGFGIPFFWPFSDARFGNWGPIHVADIALEWPDPRTSQSVRDELLWAWLPTAVLVGLVTAGRWWRTRRAATAGPHGPAA